MKDKRLGDYLLVKLLGQGSLGTLYLGEHTFMHRQYAIKLLPEKLSSDRTFIQRFEEEIATLASLDHPHIAKIHNISFSNGHYFIVLDCIVDETGDPNTLWSYLATLDSPLSQDQVWTLLQQIASALDYIHSKKLGDQPLLHRGLKLSNILLKQTKGSLHAVITDCGLSKIIGPGMVLVHLYQQMAETLALSDLIRAKSQDPMSPPSPDSHRLQALANTFTNAYAFLAPEQKAICPLDQRLSPATDSYAFGVLAYYLLTQRFPEGSIFPLSLPSGSYPWEALLTATLDFNPSQRPQELISFMNSLRKVPVPAASPTAHLKPLLRAQEIQRPEYDPDPERSLLISNKVAHYAPQELSAKDQPSHSPLLTDMAIIPGGEYYRGSTEGSRDEVPAHMICLSTFAIDIHPVSNEQFVRFLEDMGGEKDNNNHDIIRLKESRIKRSAGTLSIESGYAKHPVIGITWYGALAYAKWLGKRLPTEAEWEVASRGGDAQALYPTGKNIEKSQANFFSSDTTSVMSYPPNAYGLYDMAGNVYEWCQDWYSYNYYEISVQEPKNPQGPIQGVYRVLRGGCWKSLKEDMRCSHRNRNNPGTVNRTYGFRCAADVTG